MNLSFIIPIYNGGKFIENLGSNIKNIHQAIDDVEFIIVNDGSTDDTSEKLHRFLNDHPEISARCRLIECENGGVSRARNQALDQAVGRYVMFMDHDDNVDAVKLGGLFNSLCVQDADILHFNCRYPVSGHRQTVDTNRFMVDFPFVSYVWGYIYRRSLIENIGLRFNENMKYLEDGLFVLAYLFQTDKIMVSDEQVYDYVDNPDSAMRAQRSDAQNKKFLDDVSSAVKGYTELAESRSNSPVYSRLKEIRDSFLFIYIVNMLKLNLGKKEFFSRLQNVGYDFKMANYPSKFNNRLPVRMLCGLFRSKPLLNLTLQTGAFNLLRKFV
ncbi:glycosyltransferase [Neisseria dumasiana]|uniref:Glycosyltransferase 2-like domain-containing protein n=1 Tax=Neisseria dumasiana TaxID=1931275 RepID=A0ABX3WMT0_9NEIS|nr:glycosyltransferase [Neisseria dumasiana]OSI35050.1 hypothetical protein BV913_05990 [Neisseria dumasiana]UOO84409.1 glycosyltransferase [Neisseria dumasiana]